VFDAVVIGLGSMIGAGIFAALAPASRAAGSGLLLGLAVAAVVAYCNATSSARLAARYPQSGGTYVYGRERLGPFWGYLAGWGFVVVLAVLIAVVVVCLGGGTAHAARLDVGTDASLGGVLQAAGLLFFAFAGYARIARVGAAVAALGSLLALILGVSRTTLAMARDHHLPHALAVVHPRFKVPHRAELAVGAVVAVLAATTDVRGAIGFSSFGVLAYYAISNASAWTLSRAEGRPARMVPIVGAAGCLVLAFSLPLASVLWGAAVIAAGAAVYGVRRTGDRRAA
jgi:APA family basic amino acid/polyamine antiporter